MDGRHVACKERIAGVERREVVDVAVEQLGFLASPAVRVLLAAGDDGVDGDQDGQDPGQSGLHSDQDHASDGLRSLCNAELLDEDEDAHD